MKCFQSCVSVSLSVHGGRGGGPHVTITHDAFDLTVQVWLLLTAVFTDWTRPILTMFIAGLKREKTNRSQTATDVAMVIK